MPSQTKKNAVADSAGEFDIQNCLIENNCAWQLMKAARRMIFTGDIGTVADV
jgi:hypothetical protein